MCSRLMQIVPLTLNAKVEHFRNFMAEEFHGRGRGPRRLFFIASSPDFSASLISRAIVAQWRPVCFA
jgi:hypothetical protein